MFEFKKTISLEAKIAQMLIAGFRGDQRREFDIILKEVSERNLGGIILSQDVCDGSLSDRKGRSPQQIAELTSFLQEAAEVPLFIAVDQESGCVNRFKTGYGYPEILSYEELGNINDLQFTEEHGRKIAKVLLAAGINLNLAPVVDLDAAPQNLVGKTNKRGFSNDPELVAAHAAAFIRGHRIHGILTCAKHFPGQGSAADGSQPGLMNVTGTWTAHELIPFQRLIGSGLCNMVMSTHAFNAKWDPHHPATLSVSVLTGMLRHELGFKGLVLSDDMEAIASQHGLEKALLMAVEAGVDLLCFGNSMNSDASIVEKLIAILSRHVKEGRLPEARIDSSYNRIQKFKKNQLMV